MSARVATEYAPTVTARAMKPGQIGTMQYGDEQVLVLKTYEYIVDLNRPSRTWSANTTNIDIDLLPAGSKVELTAE